MDDDAATPMWWCVGKLQGTAPAHPAGQPPSSQNGQGSNRNGMIILLASPPQSSSPLTSTLTSIPDVPPLSDAPRLGGLSSQAEPVESSLRAIDQIENGRGAGTHTHTHLLCLIGRGRRAGGWPALAHPAGA